MNATSGSNGPDFGTFARCLRFLVPTAPAVVSAASESSKRPATDSLMQVASSAPSHVAYGENDIVLVHAAAVEHSSGWPVADGTATASTASATRPAMAGPTRMNQILME